jgi:hypothetical protein
MIYLFIHLFIFAVLRFELRAYTLATPPALFWESFFFFFSR